MRGRPTSRLALAKASGDGLGTQVTRKCRGNRAWGSGIIAAAPPTVSEFERVVARLRLKPDEYVASSELREWAEANKDTRYVPERLLKAWGVSLRGSIDDIG
jgi:hypothetical protein